MPCDSSYMNANNLEIECSRMLCLLEELSSGTMPDPQSSEWHGYHNEAYSKGASRSMADALAAELCEKLTERGGADGLSLEMQTWWRDHQRADAAREAREREAQREFELKARALEKLTPEERKVLGLR